MNIKITDSELFNKLKEYSIYSTIVGSTMYKTNNSKSDLDILYILLPVNNSLFKNHHQFQYKLNNEDHLFVFLDTFLLNSFNGDSTINFEIIQNLELDTNLDWFYKNKLNFFTYSIIKSYLGLAKRDIKYFSKEVDLYKKRKKLSHIYRGILFAENIINKEFNLDLSNDENILRYFTFETDLEFETEINKLSIKMSKLREYSNKLKDSKLIPFYLPIDFQYEIDKEYDNLCNKLKLEYSLPYTLQKKLDYEYYKSNELGIVY